MKLDIIKTEEESKKALVTLFEDKFKLMLEDVESWVD